MSAPYSDPLGYFLTWTTYGTWLPGDERGWNKKGRGARAPDRARKMRAQSRMNEPACVLTAEQRTAVRRAITEHCAIRGWHLHVQNVRTNHVHVVVTAPGYHPGRVAHEFKDWGTRYLRRAGFRDRKTWWTEGESKHYLNTDEELESTIIYARDLQ